LGTSVQISPKLTSKFDSQIPTPNDPKPLKTFKTIHNLMAGKWTPEEDQTLGRLVTEFGNNWDAIHQQMNGRSVGEISARWTKVLNPALAKGSFVPGEDALILQFVKEHGEDSWSQIVTVLPERNAKQCRARWNDHLNPSINHGPWTPEEDAQIFGLHRQFGPKWSTIAPLVQGRTENSVKNRYNSSICKRIERNSSGVMILMPPRTRTYVKKSPTRRTTRDALARQAFSLSRALAAAPANPIAWNGFPFAALDWGDPGFFEPWDWSFTSPGL
jgi:hypothetical protein